MSPAGLVFSDVISDPAVVGIADATSLQQHTEQQRPIGHGSGNHYEKNGIQQIRAACLGRVPWSGVAGAVDHRAIAGMWAGLIRLPERAG